MLAAELELMHWIVIGVGVFVALVFLSVFGPLMGLWVQALSAGAGISITELVGMRIRRVNPNIIVWSRIQAVQAGLDIPVADLERHYLIGGRPANVVRALIVASRAGIALSWDEATGRDLMGHDVLAEVQEACQETETGRPSV